MDIKGMIHPTIYPYSEWEVRIDSFVPRALRAGMRLSFPWETVILDSGGILKRNMTARSVVWRAHI